MQDFPLVNVVERETDLQEPVQYQLFGKVLILLALPLDVELEIALCKSKLLVSHGR